MEQRKHLTDNSCNEKIRKAIRDIALKGIVNSQTGTIRDTGKVTGYVAKLHMDEEDELFGTVDVQEYCDWGVKEDENNPIGYHEGVYLTALNNGNTDGFVIIPKIYSEVVVTRDPETGHEYVTMFSQVDYIQVDAFETVSIGVKEREEYYVDYEDYPDIDELEPTGVESNTTYHKDSITTTVQGEGSSNHTSQVIDSTRISQVIGDDKTSLEMTQDSANITHDKGKLDITGSESTLTQGSSKVKVTDGVVYVGSDGSTDDAVLGKQLAGILEDILDALAQVKTTTQLGPQPFINLPQFIALKAKISAFKGADSGFLTPKVKIQK